MGRPIGTAHPGVSGGLARFLGARVTISLEITEHESWLDVGTNNVGKVWAA